ncbi:ubiquitin carboxyl-terminal hydrolase CYLD-like isoform X2 [Halichondria panicea]|uniref:ubiquitin carboxyl-terminal hydrolase CYLD-like isoform X2 n=1 Tax=Halichondria panicea TaxID=6063 RepID=UPI00312BAE79
MAEHNIQQKVLEEAERVKKDKKKEAEENKSARLDQIIFALNESISKQKALLDIFNEEKREEDQKRKAQQEEARTKERAHPIIDKGSSNPYNLGVGSTVQVASVNPNDPPHPGVIRWTGRVAGVDGQVAGMELEDYMDGCTDGTFKATGKKHFTCAHGKGLYFPLASLRPDGRFEDAFTPQDNPIQAPMEEQADQTIYDTYQQMRRYIGNSRGIQGHQNSCYMDSTIFGLFALSDIFGSMFLYPDQSITSDQNRKRVADLLWKGIVNPLRKNGVVRFESVMKMRNALDELGKTEGITEKERDPEEFLNMFFKHMLPRPFISIRRPFGVEQEFFVQLFVEHDPNLRLPTVGDLLRNMYTEQHISFTKVPSKLLLQVPRFGREFQTYKKIVPELKLNIKELTDTYKKAPAPPCHSCGEESAIQCESCGPLSQQQFTHYCQRCSDLYHSNPHKDRANHRLTAVDYSVGGDNELYIGPPLCDLH